MDSYIFTEIKQWKKVWNWVEKIGIDVYRFIDMLKDLNEQTKKFQFHNGLHEFTKTFIQVLAQTINRIILKLGLIVSYINSMNISARDRSEDQKMTWRHISEIFEAVLLWFKK